MVLTAIYIIFIIVSSLAICHPYSYFWDKSQNGVCGNQLALYMTGGIFNLLLDITIVVLPMPMLWGLQMATGKKIALTGAFGIGAGYVQPHSFEYFSEVFNTILILSAPQNRICIISILRIIYLTDLDLHNITYSIAPEGLFTLLEPTLGIVCACIPIIQPAITKLSRKITPAFSTAQSGSGKAGCSTAAENGAHGQNSAFSPKRFRRLSDHAFPLTDTYGRFNRNHVGRAEDDICNGDQHVDEHAYVSSDLRNRRSPTAVKSGWPVHDNAV